MAGGGAAASALSSPWRALLQRALDANAHLKHSTFFQLATVGSSPSSVVADGAVEDGWIRRRLEADAPPALRFWCLRQMASAASQHGCSSRLLRCEICWYFTDSWEQFRISGIIDVIDGSSSDPVKLQQREKAWFASSVKSRLQYLGPCPGVPAADDDHIKDANLDPSAGPVDAYCVLTLDPEKVDYVNLRSNQRLMFTRTQEGDESSDWMAEKVSP